MYRDLVMCLLYFFLVSPEIWIFPPRVLPSYRFRECITAYGNLMNPLNRHSEHSYFPGA